jgi:Leucine-rich repeat (LRR) protein
LEDFPNVTRLKCKSDKVKNIEGINALKSLEILYLECNNADLKPLSGLKTLKEFAGPLDNLPFVTNNKQIQRLWLKDWHGEES